MPRPDRAVQRRGQPILFLATLLLVWGSWRWLMAGDGGQWSGLADSDIRSTGTITEKIPEQAIAAAPLAPPGATMLQPVMMATVPRNRAGAKQQLPPDLQVLMQAQWLDSIALGNPQKRLLLNETPLVFPGTGTDQGNAAASAPAPLSRAALRKQGRKSWSFYGWALYRPGGNSATLAGMGQYGGSQAGMMLRYSPFGSTGIMPEFYARVTQALHAGETMLALGAAIHPLERLPATQLQIEHRFALQDQGRPGWAASLTGGFSAPGLPGDIAAQGYGQIGAIGLENTEIFFDLALVARREVARRGKANVALGAGSWAGGQSESIDNAADRFTYRIDAGPGATLNLPVAGGTASLSMDWRQRIGGNAEPGSGLVVSLSTDF